MTELIFLRWISLFTSSSLSCAPSPERIIERLKAEGQMIFAEERLYPHHQPAVLFTHKRDVLAPSTIFSTSLMGRKTPEMRLSPNRKWSPDDSMWRKIAHQIPSLHSDKYWWMDMMIFQAPCTTSHDFAKVPTSFGNFQKWTHQWMIRR